MKKLEYDPNELSQKALSLLEQNKFLEASDIFDRLLKDFNDNVQLINLTAFCYMSLKDFKKSENLYLKSLEIEKAQNEAKFNLAIIKSELKKLDEAILIYEELREHDAKNVHVLINLSNIYQDQGEYDKSLRILTEAKKIVPNDPKVMMNLGQLNQHLENYQESLDIYSNLLNNGHKDEMTLINRGNLFDLLGDKNNAEKDYIDAVELSDSDNSKLHLGLFYLACKEFDKGWKYYDSRWNIYRDQKNNFNSISLLDNLDEKGKILVWAEQGLGTQIIFIPLIKELQKTQLNISYACDERLKKIIENSVQNVNVINLKDNIDLDQYDFQIPIASLGKFFRKKESDFKPQQSFLDVNENEYKSFQKNIFKEEKKSLINKLFIPKKKVIGISWKSVSINSGSEKSISLNSFTNLVNNSKHQFINLQYGNVFKEIKDFNDQSKNKIRFFENCDFVKDLDRFACFVKSCDVIITTSNTTAHFAGALGIQTFVLVPENNGKIWYWHEKDGKSLWYKSVQLISYNINNLQDKIQSISF